MAAISNDWYQALKPELSKPYYRELYAKVVNAYKTESVFPPADDIFNAFHYTPLANVKAVIIGQDPYIKPGQAHGLCFSVRKGIELPPSLDNIFKELETDVGFVRPGHGYLKKWADEGVLMLNSILTVREGVSLSHKSFGWENFTDAAIKVLNGLERPIVFLLWGSYARSKKTMLNNPKHLVLETVHPSPLSVYRGFFGCRHFSRCNQFLISNGISPIDWQIY